MENSEWHVYTGEALHDTGVLPIVVKLTPDLVEQLEQCNHTAWSALIQYVMDCRTLDDST